VGKSQEEQAVSGEDGPVIIVSLGHGKGLFRSLEKLHVSSSPLFEAKKDGCSGNESQEVLQSLHQQRKGGLEVDAISSEDDVGLEIENFLGERLAPGLYIVGQTSADSQQGPAVRIRSCERGTRR
jgi:hypothetical protein